MTIKTRKSNPHKALRLVICGTPGIGKSSLGAKAEKPVFLPLEDGADHLFDEHGKPVDILEEIKTYADARRAVEQLLGEAHSWKTLVVDSADWLEKLVHAQVIGGQGTDIIRANKGYGAGFAESVKIHKEFLGLLTRLRDEKDINVLVTAHTHVKPVKDPSVMDDYDIFEMKCHKDVSDLWREWSDIFLFARKAVYTKATDDTLRARALMSDVREVVTEEQSFFKAKNRYKLPPKMPFTENFWKDLQTHIKKNPNAYVAPGSLAEVTEEIQARFDSIDDTELKQKIRFSVESAGIDLSKLNPILKRLRELQGKAL